MGALFPGPLDTAAVLFGGKALLHLSGWLKSGHKPGYGGAGLCAAECVRAADPCCMAAAAVCGLHRYKHLDMTDYTFVQVEQELPFSPVLPGIVGQ